MKPKKIKADSILTSLLQAQQGAKIDLPVEDLLARKAPYNPREISPASMQRLRASLREFGVADPVCVNIRTGNLVGGHQRVEAAKAEGWERFPVWLVDLPLAREAALNVALNNPAMQGRYLDAGLAAVFDIIAAGGEDPRLTGFREAEIVRLLQVTKAGSVSPDTIVEDVEKRCAFGDVWQLGKHRLVCGDATQPETIARLWNADTRPTICVTDPPYGVEYDPSWRSKAARIGNVTNDDRADWSAVWALTDCDVIYAWSAPGGLMVDAGLALTNSGYEIRASIIWRKTNFPISRGHYTFTHEPCWYAVKAGRNAHWIGPANASTVWEVSLDENVPGGHSTQKPVELFRRAISSHQGNVFEPFCGSGTCLIACEQLDRTCFAVEIEPHYCDVILARWEMFTGGKAVNVSGNAAPAAEDA